MRCRWRHCKDLVLSEAPAGQAIAYEENLPKFGAQSREVGRDFALRTTLATDKVKGRWRSSWQCVL